MYLSSNPQPSGIPSGTVGAQDPLCCCANCLLGVAFGEKHCAGTTSAGSADPLLATKLSPPMNRLFETAPPFLLLAPGYFQAGTPFPCYWETLCMFAYCGLVEFPLNCYFF